MTTQQAITMYSTIEALANQFDQNNMKEIKLTIEWEHRDEETIRGFLRGHSETTLFLLVAADREGRVKLQGAFVPDEDEKETWGIENAKAAAGHRL